MPAGHSTGRIPEVLIAENDFGDPTMHVFVSMDGISLTGTMENLQGEIVRDPENHNQPFRFEFGIEDWTVAASLGADLIDAALKLRKQGLDQVRWAEDEHERSALFNAPDPEELS